MSASLADTNILIELYRKHPAAGPWFAAQHDLAITSISWLEFIEGARGKAGQVQCLHIIAQFGMEFLTHEDQQWAMLKLLRYRLSHGVTFADCLIASVAHRLQIPVYTRNVKDFLVVLPANQVIQPY